MKSLLRQLLVANAGVTALVPASSIQWGKRIGCPAIALHRISGSPDYHFEGQSSLGGGVAQIVCWARSEADADDIAGAVKAVLSGHRDAVFQGVFIQDERNASENADGAAGAGAPTTFHRSDLDIRVRFNDA